MTTYRLPRWKVSAEWTDSEGARYWFGMSEIGNGMRLRDALKLWLWFLVKHRTVAKITRKQQQRFYFTDKQEAFLGRWPWQS